MATQRSARAKGKGFEKEVAEYLASWLGVEEQDITNARSGKQECDIQMSSAAAKLFPYWLEAKNHKNLKIPEWIDQAVADAKGKKAPLRVPGDPEDLVPIVVFKRHRDTTKWACLPFADFMRLATANIELRRKLAAITKGT